MLIVTAAVNPEKRRLEDLPAIRKKTSADNGRACMEGVRKGGKLPNMVRLDAGEAQKERACEAVRQA